MVSRINVIEFITGEPPKGFKKDFESFLFNTPSHRQTQSRYGWREFHLIDKKKKKILASVAFHVKGKIARSPLKAPFGSYEFSDSITLPIIINFITNVDNVLKKSGVTKIEIINHPEIYFKKHNTLAYALIDQGYSPYRCDVSCSMKVDKTPLLEKMNKAKRKQYRQSLKLGFRFRNIRLSKIDEVYDFISTCREERSQTLSLSKKELNTIVNTLPKAFKLVGVYNKRELIAASVCIHVNKEILYTFYSAHKKTYDSSSPLTFLLNNLYTWCNSKHYRLLDMGTSTVNGKSNFNLLDFKLRVGGIMSPKFSFRKVL